MRPWSLCWRSNQPVTCGSAAKLLMKVTPCVRTSSTMLMARSSARTPKEGGGSVSSSDAAGAGVAVAGVVAGGGALEPTGTAGVAAAGAGACAAGSGAEDETGATKDCNSSAIEDSEGGAFGVAMMDVILGPARAAPVSPKK